MKLLILNLHHLLLLLLLIIIISSSSSSNVIDLNITIIITYEHRVQFHDMPQISVCNHGLDRLSSVAVRAANFQSGAYSAPRVRAVTSS